MSTTLRPEVLLGTVALEPNRWGTIRSDRSPELHLPDWTARIAGLGVDGLEVWEHHLTYLPAAEVQAVVDGPVPVRIFNSYVSFDESDPAERDRAAAWVARSGARAVKFNVGNDPLAERDYASRLARWLEVLPDDAAAICECHRGISIAEDPLVAARMLGAAGPPARVQALVHTHDDHDLLAAKFEALGERITHVHVNHLDTSTMEHPRLAEIEDALGRSIHQLRRLGFSGSWTLEFVAGLLTERDHPAALLEQAAVDLVVLHRLLEDG